MKKIFSLITAAALCLSLAACTQPAKETDANTTTLRVGASPAPHAEILEKAKEILAKDGINLEIVEFTDYVLPNTTLDTGDLDANFFQHVPYLEKFNADNGTNIVSVGAVHFEPLGVYPGKSSDLNDIKDGAVIAIPSDESNGARALLLLQDLGIITLKDGVGLSATPLDIVGNEKNIEIFEIEAVQLPQILPDVDFAVINGNYASQANILDSLLASENKDGEGAKIYGNILAVNAGNEQDENIEKLYSVLTSAEIKEYIVNKYGDLFVALF